MVNLGARYLVPLTAAAVLTCGCSDDGATAPSPVEDAASPDGGSPEAGASSRAQSAASDAAASRPDGSTLNPATSSETRGNEGATSEQDRSTSALPVFTASETSEPQTSEAQTSEALTSAPGDTSSQEAVVPGAVVFAADQVLDVAITLSEANLLSLDEHGNAEAYLPGEVTISGDGFDTYAATGVGVRHKGAYSLHHCWVDNVRNYENECAKLSLKLKFDEFADGQRFDGLKRLNLHASSGDNTKLRELLAYTTFAEFGVDAPRISIARVTVNGVLRGLFFAVEELDGRYAAAHYPEGPDGNLYKEVWPVKAQTEEAYIEALETNDETPDVSDIRAFADAIDRTTEATFEADMAPWVNIDDIVRYLVVDRAMKNWDGIMAFYEPLRPHNFFWYHDSGSDSRFHLIPWDLDNTFWATDPYMTPQEWFLNVPPVPDWNVTPLDCYPRPVWDIYSGTYITPPRCDKFLDLLAKTQWTRFVELGAQFKEEILESPHFMERLDHWETLLASLVSEDPTLSLASVATDQVYFRYILTDLISDFGQYMERGLQEETIDPGPVLLPEPTEEELTAISSPRGIEPGRVTNFEFDFNASTPGDAGAEPVSYVAPTSTILASSNVSALDAAAFSDPATSNDPATLNDAGAAVLSTPSVERSTSELMTDNLSWEAGAPPPPASVPLPFSEVVVSPYSTASAQWNTQTPIAGSADARVDFTHYSEPGPYNEWVNLFLYMNDGVVDVRQYTQIEMTLRADTLRNVRVRIGGAAASFEFGGVWDEFGADFTVDSEPTHVVLPLHQLMYPEWAKAAWQEGQGWTFSDDIARQYFLATMWGLIFVPGARVDGEGELMDATDVGFLQIDNLYFR